MWGDNVRIYLDNCCFNRPFDDQTQLKINLEAQAKLAVQQSILNGEYDLVWSYMLEYENIQNPFEVRRNSIISWKNIAKDNVVASEDVILYAENLQKIGLKPKDAIHIACAKISKCEYFLTTDKGILKKKDMCEINIINPIDFVCKEE